MHWDARRCSQLHKQSGAQLRFVVKMDHAHYGKMMLEVIECDRGSAYAGKHTSFEIDVCPAGPSVEIAVLAQH